MLDKYIDREVLPSGICPQFGKGKVMPQYRFVNLEGGPLTCGAKASRGTSKDGESSVRTLETTLPGSFADEPQESQIANEAVRVSSSTLCNGSWGYSTGGVVKVRVD